MGSGWIVWGGFLGICVAVGAAIVRTRWLQSQTLKKCVLLSVAFHALLAVVAATVGGTRPASWGTADEGPMTMMVVLADEPTTEAVPAPAEAATVEASDDPEMNPPEDLAATAPPDDFVPLLADAEAEKQPESPQATDAPPKPADQQPARRAVPDLYADRVGGRRAAAAAARGGSLETERAVQAALAWLAAAQSPDGRWSAAAHGAGVERSVQGHHRHGAGAKSDHGVTGLALLAFLGAGHTHTDGGHAGTVSRGLRLLVDRQRSDGSLAGDAEFFASLYCHGMATIALAEACAMTGDEALQPPLDRAVRYTLAMQSPATGGWRYAAGDRGDTSQLGWQVMVLASARQAGIGGLEEAESRARGFLRTVSSGRAGGLAAYRAGERPTLAMTAEALACRLFLGMPPDHPAALEAVDMLAQSPPARESPNAYAWYYATLASFHAGGPQWDRWNERLHSALLPLQRREPGSLAGSWDPDPVWGGHGGRVYSTALSAMTLEVYYRHLPMHRQAAGAAATLP
ncbi:MAG: hypothetical protein ACK54F_11545 [Planctomycetia bacterium]|jgi:hypothetical protein